MNPVFCTRSELPGLLVKKGKTGYGLVNSNPVHLPGFLDCCRPSLTGFRPGKTGLTGYGNTTRWLNLDQSQSIIG